MEKEKELVSTKEEMGERVKDLESRLGEKEGQVSQKDREILTLRGAEDRNRELDASGLGR